MESERYKMKYRVLQNYTDKNTKVFCEVGDIVEYPQERANEILGQGEYIQLVGQEEKKPAKKRGKE